MKGPNGQHMALCDVYAEEECNCGLPELEAEVKRLRECVWGLEQELEDERASVLIWTVEDPKYGLLDMFLERDGAEAALNSEDYTTSGEGPSVLAYRVVTGEGAYTVRGGNDREAE